MHDLARRRTLHGHERVTRAGVHSYGIADAHDLLPDPRVVLVDIRGVDHQQEVIGGEAVHQQVVHERAVRHHEAGVVCLPDLELCGVVAREALHRRECIGAGHLDLPHVADVEEARARAYREMLVRDAGILDRHLPTGKRHHACAKRDMASVQSSLLDCCSVELCHGGVSEGGRRALPDI